MLLIFTAISNQVSIRFDDTRATSVKVVSNSSDLSDISRSASEGAVRLREITGVIGAASVWRYASVAVAANGLQSPSDTRLSAPVLAFDRDGLVSLGLAPRGLKPREILLGPALRRRLIPDDRGGTTWLDGVPFGTAGVIEPTPLVPGLSVAVVMDDRTAAEMFAGRLQSLEFAVRTVPGGAQAVGRIVPAVVSPGSNDEVSVTVPPDPRGFRSLLESDLRRFVLVAAIVCLLVGTLGLSNATLASIRLRANELALRRVMGARRGHLQLHVMVETALVGALGGVLGSITGLAIASITSMVNRWKPSADLRLIAVGPVLGLVAGVVSGIWPAARAARVDPAEVLSSP
jgi:putative ABC transport system permease protein